MAAILLYHALADDVRDERLQVRPGTLARHLDWCIDHEYRIVPLDEALGSPDERVVAVTFDDGLVSTLLALPILRDRGIAATGFVCPGMLGRENSWASPGRVRERLLDAGEVLALREQGFALGCHGWDHRPFRGRSAAEVADDLGRCRAWFEANLGAVPDAFAWPFGKYDARSWSVLGREYRWGLLAEAWSREEIDPLRMPRFAPWEGLEREAFGDWLDGHAFGRNGGHRGHRGHFD